MDVTRIVLGRVVFIFVSNRAPSCVHPCHGPVVLTLSFEVCCFQHLLVDRISRGLFFSIVSSGTFVLVRRNDVVQVQLDAVSPREFRLGRRSCNFNPQAPAVPQSRCVISLAGRTPIAAPDPPDHQLMVDGAGYPSPLGRP
jgi:hypothetical protein